MRENRSALKVKEHSIQRFPTNDELREVVGPGIAKHSNSNVIIKPVIHVSSML